MVGDHPQRSSSGRAEPGLRGRGGDKRWRPPRRFRTSHGVPAGSRSRRAPTAVGMESGGVDLAQIRPPYPSWPRVLAHKPFECPLSARSGPSLRVNVPASEASHLWRVPCRLSAMQNRAGHEGTFDGRGSVTKLARRLRRPILEHGAQS